MTNSKTNTTNNTTINFINLTPHTINLNDGRSFVSQGVARVTATFSEIENDICSQNFGDIIGLPKPEKGVIYIVSGIVLNACKELGIKDCVAPASGHTETKRNEKGHIVSVPCFVQ